MLLSELDTLRGYRISSIGGADVTAGCCAGCGVGCGTGCATGCCMSGAG